MNTVNLIYVAATPLEFLLGLCGGATNVRGGIAERIDGSFSNMMGLPTERLRMALEQLGVAARAWRSVNFHSTVAVAAVADRGCLFH